MSAATRVRLHLVPGGVRRGLWCDEHALSHAEELTVYGMGDAGELVTLRSIRRCS